MLYLSLKHKTKNTNVNKNTNVSGWRFLFKDIEPHINPQRLHSHLGNRRVVEGGPSSVDQLSSFLEFELHCNYTQISSAPQDRPINNHLLLCIKKSPISLLGLIGLFIKEIVSATTDSW
jgi:hypothetical protein